MIIKKQMTNSVRYVGNKCSACNNAYHYDPVPLYVALLMLFLIVILFGFIYIKYITAKKESQLCMAFRQMEKHTKEDFKDIFNT
jgi:hypothetical protein